MERIRQIDFTKKKSEKTEESETTTKSTKWIWSKVNDNIMYFVSHFIQHQHQQQHQSINQLNREKNVCTELK